MQESLPFLTAGVLLGLTAGMMPGPLTTLVITETLRHTRRQGMIVAAVPVVTDLPIIAVSLAFLSSLAHISGLLGGISLIGACFLGYLAYEGLSARGVVLGSGGESARALRRGIVTNFLSPNPYLFWMTVGGPLVLRGYDIGILSVLLFVMPFYLLLIATKMALAAIVGRFKTFLSSSAYVWVLRCLGLLMLVYAVICARDGLRLLSMG